MVYNKYIHNRRSIRLKNYDYSQSGIYFVTICTKDRLSLFGEIIDNQMVLNEYGIVVNNMWLNIPNHFSNIKLDIHCIMPNHIHGIIIIDDITPVGAKHFSPHELNRDDYLANINNGFETTDEIKPRINGTSKTIGSVIRGFKIGVTKELGFPIFQRNYHEHIIRNTKSYKLISQYIYNNPCNWENDVLFSLNCFDEFHSP